MGGVPGRGSLLISDLGGDGARMRQEVWGAGVERMRCELSTRALEGIGQVSVSDNGQR